MRDSVATAAKPATQVRERKARESGPQSRREKSLERRNPKGAADCLRRKTRGWLSNSQREQSPETEPFVTDHECIRRIAPMATVGGQRPRTCRWFARGTALVRTAQAGRTSERKKLRRGNPRSDSLAQVGDKPWEASTVRGVKTSKAASLGGHTRTSHPWLNAL